MDENDASSRKTHKVCKEFEQEVMARIQSSTPRPSRMDDGPPRGSLFFIGMCFGVIAARVACATMHS